MAGKGTPATALLAAHDVEHRLHSYAHGGGTAYGPEAAELLGLDPARVFKTLVAEVDGALTVGVVPVVATLDLKALAAAAGGKRARMAEVTAAERATGYVAGGISPLAQRKRLPTVIDATAAGFETVFCSAGRRGLEVELAPADLAAPHRRTARPDRGLRSRRAANAGQPLPAAAVGGHHGAAWLGRSPSGRVTCGGRGEPVAPRPGRSRRRWSGPSTRSGWPRWRSRCSDRPGTCPGTSGGCATTWRRRTC